VAHCCFTNSGASRSLRFALGFTQRISLALPAARRRICAGLCDHQEQKIKEQTSRLITCWVTTFMRWMDWEARSQLPCGSKTLLLQVSLWALAHPWLEPWPQPGLQQGAWAHPVLTGYHWCFGQELQLEHHCQDGAPLEPEQAENNV
jgi:hypothetical protein